MALNTSTDAVLSQEPKRSTELKNRAYCPCCGATEERWKQKFLIEPMTVQTCQCGMRFLDHYLDEPILVGQKSKSLSRGVYSRILNDLEKRKSYIYSKNDQKMKISENKILSFQNGHQTFFEVAKNKEWKVQEASADASSQKDLSPLSQDFITLWDTLQNSTAPLLMLQHCYKLLKEGGHLFVSVPNDQHMMSSWGQKIYQWSGGKITLGLRQSYHLKEPLYFSPFSLTTLMQLVGFSVQKVTTMNSGLGLSLPVAFSDRIFAVARKKVDTGE